MSASQVLAAVTSLVTIIKEAPELVSAIKAVLDDLEHGHDTTPALKHLEAVAAAKELGIPYP